MPQKIKHKVLLFFTMLFISTISNSQTDNKKINCLNIDTMGLLKKSFDSFEKDLFNHYKFSNDSIKTYKTFLTELYSLSINLRKLPSNTSIELARVFKKKAADKSSLWVLLSTYDEQMETSGQNSTPKTNPQQNEEEIMTFNYRGGFIQCLKNNSSSNGFKDIINTLEYDGNISPSLIAQRLHDLPAEEFNTPEVKNFIAFDIYYSILLIIEKAFK